MSTITHNAPGAADIGPGRSGHRTGADQVADVVSLIVLASLGGFAIAVSFSHTMAFVRSHGQLQTWIVIGTALTVVGLTVQSGLEVYRDSRDGRGRGWPTFLLACGVGAELYANASTAHGGTMNRIVAAWPVPVAAAALALWTRRLQHAAEMVTRAAAAADVSTPPAEASTPVSTPPAEASTPDDSAVSTPDEANTTGAPRLTTEAARAVIRYGWANKHRVRETAAAATRSPAYVSKVFATLDEQQAQNQSGQTGQMDLVGAPS